MSNIKFTNNVLLDQTSVDGITGIDISNKLSESGSFTATQDCFCINSGSNGILSARIDGKEVSYHYNPNNYGHTHIFPVKKGQTVTKQDWQGNLQFYGLKK